MKFFGWLRRKQLAEPAAPAMPVVVEPHFLANSDEVFIERLVADLAGGKRQDELNRLGEWTIHLDTMWKRGRELLAIEWMEKILLVPEVAWDTSVHVRAGLMARYEQRRETAAAAAHAAQLTSVVEYALAAHALLADFALRNGDDIAALRHYEAVLMYDVTYPNALARVERLRIATGRVTASPGATIAGGDLRGVDSGGRYRLLRELGRGATGAVYVARDTQLDRDVAVKLLHPHLAKDGKADSVAAFFREARVTASLRHPNIVAVLDLDESARRIVMELAAGGTMREVLRTRGRRTVRRAIERHVQILSALHAAHRNGIVHRDLKPANLMFRRDPDLPGVEVMLGDFGVAHLPDSQGADSGPIMERTSERLGAGPIMERTSERWGAGPIMERTSERWGAGPIGLATESSKHRRGDAVGTLAYMAPEQRRGEITAASDVFASAVVLFEMMTATVPWSREQILAGARNKDDFVLPEEICIGVRPSIASDIAEHLRLIGHLDAMARPTTEAALQQAQQLRARLIANHG
jgi:serine/threonine protein kinase